MEVAGLVLGALPLILSAIESYDTVAQISSNYWHYQSILSNIRLQVFAQDEQLRRTLRLINLVDPTQQNLEMQLRRRFPGKHQNYLDIIRQMDKIAAQMMQKLDLDSRGKPAWLDNTSDRAGYEWRRVKRSISHMKTWEFVEQLQYWNNVLANCFQTPEVRVTKETISISTVKNGFDIDRCDKTRENARSVFRAVQSAWKCNDVDHRHQGNLKLSWHEGDQPHFDILAIAMTPGQRLPENLLVWHSFLVEIHDGDENTSSPAVISHSDLHIQTDAPPNTKKPQSIGRRFKAAFRRKEPAATNEILKVPSLETSVPAYREIDSLCSLIDDTSPDDRFMLGKLEDRSHILIKHEHSDSPQQLLTELKGLFSNGKRMHSPRGQIPCPSLSQRLAMSAGLCWGVLFLAETPWLAPDWEWIDDISVFIKPSNSKSVSQLPAIGWPGSNRRSTSGSGKNTISKFHIQRGINKTLFALGILLIELGLDTPFQSLKTSSLSQRAGNGRIPDDVEIADELVQKVYNSVGRSYGYAAQRCIQGDFPGRRDTHDLNLQSFRLDFFNEVVAPVQATYKYFARAF